MVKKILSLVFVLALALGAGYVAVPSADAVQCSDASYKTHHDENGDSGCFGDGSDCILCWDEVLVEDP